RHGTQRPAPQDQVAWVVVRLQRPLDSGNKSRNDKGVVEARRCPAPKPVIPGFIPGIQQQRFPNPRVRIEIHPLVVLGLDPGTRDASTPPAEAPAHTPSTPFSALGSVADCRVKPDN